MKIIKEWLKRNEENICIFFGIAVIVSLGVIACLWLSNTSFCLNYRKDMLDYIERFKWCAVRIDYLK